MGRAPLGPNQLLLPDLEGGKEPALWAVGSTPALYFFSQRKDNRNLKLSSPATQSSGSQMDREEKSLLYEFKDVTRKCHTTVLRISQLQKSRRDFLWESLRPWMQLSRANLAKSGGQSRRHSGAGGAAQGMPGKSQLPWCPCWGKPSLSLPSLSSGRLNSAPVTLTGLFGWGRAQFVLKCLLFIAG